MRWKHRYCVHLVVRIVGARVREQGVQLHIKWQDGYSSWLLTASLKPRQHCLLKMVDYYESRVKGVARKK